VKTPEGRKASDLRRGEVEDEVQGLGEMKLEDLVKEQHKTITDRTNYKRGGRIRKDTRRQAGK